MNYKLSLRVFSVLFIVVGAMFFMLGAWYVNYFGVRLYPVFGIMDKLQTSG
jgi:hypothetical protein